ncbi:hypothetical protein [Clostridium butyricum]
MIIASIIVSDNSETVEHIALVSRDFNYSINNDQLDIHLLAEQPKLYELILGDYDAVVIDDGNRQFNIQTIQSKELKSNLNEYFNHNVKMDFSKDKVKRGIGTNTLGYLVIVILFESILLMSIYPEDRAVSYYTSDAADDTLRVCLCSSGAATRLKQQDNVVTQTYT